MKSIRAATLVVGCLLASPSALAEHQTRLRAIANVPGLEGALLETDHTLAKRGNTPPLVIKTSRLVRGGEQFEDETIKGAHFKFEILAVDLVKEIVRTREGNCQELAAFRKCRLQRCAGRLFKVS